MAVNQLIENHHLVEALWSAVNTSSGSLVNVAPLIKKILATNAWQKRYVPQLGRDVEFDSFPKFLKTKPLEGCGWEDPKKVADLIRDDPVTLEKFRKVTVGPAHRLPGSTDNISTFIKPEHGTSLAYTLDRLNRAERPDLFAKVVAGELSANAAAIEAGIRKKPTPFEIVCKNWPKLTEAEKAEIRELP